MKISILPLPLILFLLFSLTNLSAQTHNWTRTNPGGGGAYSTIGASASGIIIAGSDLSGAYRSSDSGLTWDVIGQSKGLTETHISGMGFHRTDGDILYIGTENGIFRSTDGGDAVTQVLVGGYITDIEFGTNNLTKGYAAYHPTYDSNNGVIYSSTNNGVTWSQVSTDLPAGIRILKIIVNPDDANTVYILSGDGRFACGPAAVFRSTNSGVNWTNLTNALGEILDVAIDPVDPDNIFISTMNADCAETFYWTDLDGDLYKSTNGGTNWGAPLSSNTGVIWVDANSPTTIRLIDPREPYPWISSSGTWTSTNGGNTFTQTGDVNNWDTFFNGEVFYCYSSSFNGVSKTLGEDLSDPNKYYWVNSQFVYQTTDNGGTFNNIFTNEISTDNWQSRGFDNVNMMDISISKANSNIIYLAYFDIGIWRSLDHGDSWQSCNDDTYSGNWVGRGGNCATVLADPDRANVVWASQSQNQNGEPPTYLLKNANTGEKNSWLLSNTGLPDKEVMGLSIDINSSSTNRTLYVTALSDVYKSTDDGASWSMVFDCNGCRFTAVDEVDSDLLFAGGEAGLWRSEDGGINWSDVSHSDMKASASVAFWEDNYDGVFDVKIDSNNPDWVYVTALGTGKGLYKSTDRGGSWQKLITDDFMRKVAIAPQHPEILYATSSSAFEAGGYHLGSSGILFSDDSGQTWTQQNQGMDYPFALAVAVDHLSSPSVFVGSPGTGFQKSLVDDTTLPVTYLAPFSARLKEDIVLLSWHTAQESNTDFFDIERSKNLSIWKKIGAIKANHYSSTYSSLDSNPFTGNSYYRLKQVDNNGDFSYSNIIAVFIPDDQKETFLFPNPVQDLLTIRTKRKLVTTEVYNTFGEQLMRFENPMGNQLDLGMLNDGIYFIKLESTFSTTVHRVIVKG